MSSLQGVCVESKCHPQENEQRVVLARRAPEAVVVAAGAVETEVRRVLHSGAQVDPWLRPRAGLAARHILQLHDVAARVRRAVRAAAELTRRVQPGVMAPRDAEQAEAGA